MLSAYLFDSLDEVREITAEWLDRYNEIRPHDALGSLTLGARWRADTIRSGHCGHNRPRFASLVMFVPPTTKWSSVWQSINTSACLSAVVNYSSPGSVLPFRTRDCD